MKTRLGFLTEEGRTRSKNAARRISAYSALMFLLAGAGGYAIHRYWISPEFTPLQRVYLKQYLKSSYRSYLPNSKSRYTTLMAVMTHPETKKDVQVAATDGNVEPVLDAERHIVFDKNHRPRFEPRTEVGTKSCFWTEGYAQDAEAHAWLQSLIYDEQSIPDIWRPAWMGALLIFFFGTIALTALDLIAQQHYLKGQAIRGTRELSPKRYEHAHRQDSGYGIEVYAQGRTS